MGRFKIEKIECTPAQWACTDLENSIVCVFEHQKFNETQTITMLKAFNPANVQHIARICREMGDWLAENHYGKVFPMNHRKRIGESIAALRSELSMTQAQLAEIIGTTQGNIARIESGKYSITFDMLQAIAEIFQCNIGFVGMEEDD